MKKYKNFLTLRLWEFTAFECNYLENRQFPTNETLFIEFLALENPSMQNVAVIWKVHITAETPYKSYSRHKELGRGRQALEGAKVNIFSIFYNF